MYKRQGNIGCNYLTVNDVITVGQNVPFSYSVGTISQTGTTVTGSGTNFTPLMVGGYLFYGTQALAFITDYTSPTSLTVTPSGTFGAGFPFTIYYNSNPRTYSVGTASQATTIIAGVGTVFNHAMVGGMICFSGGAVARILNIANLQSLTVSVSQTVASQAYTIYYSDFSPVYSTSTASQATTTVTGVGTTFTSSMTNASLVYLTGTQTKATFATATTLTAATSQTVSATRFALYYPPTGSPTPYTTGTASQTTTNINTSGGTFTPNMAGGKIVYANGVSANIIQYNSSALLTTVQSQTVASQAYTIYFPTTPQYSTGTASQSGLAVTGTGTTFTPNMVGGTITYNAGQTYGIVAYNSPTSLTVTVGAIQASQAYAINYLDTNIYYNTGTVSQSANIITGVGTFFTPNMIGGVLTYANGTQATITDYTSSTVIIASEYRTMTSQTFNLTYNRTAMTADGNMGNNMVVANTVNANIVTGSTINVGSGILLGNGYVTGISGRVSTSGLAVSCNTSGILGTSTSSNRFKKMITTIASAVSSKIYDMRVVRFFYNEDIDSMRPQYGMIAEEMDLILPEMVARENDDINGIPYSIFYNLIWPLVLAEVQAHNKKINQINTQFATSSLPINNFTVITSTIITFATVFVFAYNGTTTDRLISSITITVGGILGTCTASVQLINTATQAVLATIQWTQSGAAYAVYSTSTINNLPTGLTCLLYTSDAADE